MQWIRATASTVVIVLAVLLFTEVPEAVRRGGWAFWVGWACWPLVWGFWWGLACWWATLADLARAAGVAVYWGGPERARSRRRGALERPDIATDHGWTGFFPICWGTYDMRQDGGPRNRLLQVGWLTFVRVPGR